MWEGSGVAMCRGGKDGYNRGTNGRDISVEAVVLDGREGAVLVTFLDAPCPWDCADDDGNVGVVDFLALLAQWGTQGACDFDGGGVGITDFLALLANWGDC